MNAIIRNILANYNTFTSQIGCNVTCPVFLVYCDIPLLGEKVSVLDSMSSYFKSCSFYFDLSTYFLWELGTLKTNRCNFLKKKQTIKQPTLKDFTRQICGVAWGRLISEPLFRAIFLSTFLLTLYKILLVFMLYS